MSTIIHDTIALWQGRITADQADYVSAFLFLSSFTIQLEWNGRLSAYGDLKLKNVCRYLAYQGGLFALLNPAPVPYDPSRLQVAATREEAQ